MTLEDFEHRLERVEAQHADYVRVLSSHTAAMAGHTATLSTLVGQVTTLQQVVGQIAGELAELHRIGDQRQAIADQRHAQIMGQLEKILTRLSKN